MRKRGILKPSDRFDRRSNFFRQNACSVETARALSEKSVDFDEHEYKVLIIEDRYNTQVSLSKNAKYLPFKHFKLGQFLCPTK